MTRRSFAPALAAAPALFASQENTAPTLTRKGRLKQSSTAGVFRGRQRTLDDMCREAAKLGISGFDLVKPEDWPIVKKYGLTPTMLPGPYGGTIPDALNRKENHDRIEKGLREAIDLAVAGRWPNALTLLGNRARMAH